MRDPREAKKAAAAEAAKAREEQEEEEEDGYLDGEEGEDEFDEGELGQKPGRPTNAARLQRTPVNERMLLAAHAPGGLNCSGIAAPAYPKPATTATDSRADSHGCVPYTSQRPQLLTRSFARSSRPSQPPPHALNSPVHTGEYEEGEDGEDEDEDGGDDYAASFLEPDDAPREVATGGTAWGEVVLKAAHEVLAQPNLQVRLLGEGGRCGGCGCWGAGLGGAVRGCWGEGCGAAAGVPHVCVERG